MSIRVAHFEVDSPQRSAFTGKYLIILLTCRRIPIRSEKEPECRVYESSYEHVVLIDSVQKKNCCFKLLIFIGDIEGSYLSLSIPFHSRTVVSQNPPKKANEEEVVVMANSSSANSEARAC